MGKLSLRVGYSVVEEDGESIVGVAFRVWDSSEVVGKDEREILFGCRFAERRDVDESVDGGMFAVDCGIEVIIDKFIDEFSPVVLEIECKQPNLVEEVSRRSMWPDELYSVNAVQISEAEGVELNAEALRATRDLREMDVETTKDIVM